MVFAEIVGTLSFLQPQADDDICDRLHYYYTSTFLLVTAVLISLKMFGGRPIECWLPAEYKPAWEDYTEMYCWSRNTYYVPFSETIPEDHVEREEKMISYYQWTPFFLVISAFLFYSPCLIWRVLYDRSGIRLKDIMAFGNDRANIQPTMRQKNVNGLAAHLTSIFRHRFCFGSQHSYHLKLMSRLLNLRFCASFLTFLYLGIKLLFLINVLCQMYLMNKFLQTDGYGIYGLSVIKDLMFGKPWAESGNFPRITYCDLDIRLMGAVQRHTVQCLLVINIFTEKVFILLWLWYSLLTVTSIGSLFSWVSSSVFFESRKRFIVRRLELADISFSEKASSSEVEEFVRDHIKMDGVFVLKMLTIHSGILVCSEVVDKMWDIYLETKQQQMEPHFEDDPKTDQLQSHHQKRKTSMLVPLVTIEEPYAVPKISSPTFLDSSPSSPYNQSPVIKSLKQQSPTNLSCSRGTPLVMPRGLGKSGYILNKFLPRGSDSVDADYDNDNDQDNLLLYSTKSSSNARKSAFYNSGRSLRR
uniref:Innexin n=1 Tax=Parastrongyloides trichosuri TaxID=131310 RepID=A0A0N4ZP26_PARTI